MQDRESTLVNLFLIFVMLLVMAGLFMAWVRLSMQPPQPAVSASPGEWTCIKVKALPVGPTYYAESIKWESQERITLTLPYGRTITMVSRGGFLVDYNPITCPIYFQQ